MSALTSLGVSVPQNSTRIRTAAEVLDEKPLIEQGLGTNNDLYQAGFSLFPGETRQALASAYQTSSILSSEANFNFDGVDPFAPSLPPGQAPQPAEQGLRTVLHRDLLDPVSGLPQDGLRSFLNNQQGNRTVTTDPAGQSMQHSRPGRRELQEEEEDDEFLDGATDEDSEDDDEAYSLEESGLSSKKRHATTLSSPNQAAKSAPSQLEGKAKGKKKVGRPIAYKGDPNDPRLTEDERRRIKRRIANRESARRVRQKRQELMDDCSSRLQLLTQQNQRLVAYVSTLENQKNLLFSQLATLRERLSLFNSENVRLNNENNTLRSLLEGQSNKLNSNVTDQGGLSNLTAAEMLQGRLNLGQNGGGLRGSSSQPTNMETTNYQQLLANHTGGGLGGLPSSSLAGLGGHSSRELNDSFLGFSQELLQGGRSDLQLAASRMQAHMDSSRDAHFSNSFLY